ncbi:MAG: hypothetical protein JKY56_12965, partial [Kofleriaceae bacterium]|nr:hypothetical protein [Kofleriaceae bacterium]
MRTYLAGVVTTAILCATASTSSADIEGFESFVHASTNVTFTSGLEVTFGGDFSTQDGVEALGGSNFGAGSSQKWCGTTFPDSNPTVTGTIASSDPSMGFTVEQIAVWTSASGGNSDAVGTVTFTGVLPGGGTFSENFLITPTGLTGADWDLTSATFSNAAWNQTIVELRVTATGALNYVALDLFDHTPVALANCGNGIVEVGEACDGNGSGTGGETASCNADCTAASCGDGTINTTAGETCDDGDGDNTDACPDGVGGTCLNATCGDGFVLSGTETCDDGDGDNTDACPDGVGGTCLNATCGDGFVLSGTESCDDGDGDNTDACPDGVGGSCQAATCGDGFVRTSTETCDDGDGDNTDACPDGVGGTCIVATCGDGFVRAGTETCDDGDGDNTDACPDGAGGSCLTATCGDGFVLIGTETCDDGDGDNTDVCPDGVGGTCLTATCGDG